MCVHAYVCMCVHAYVCMCVHCTLNPMIYLLVGSMHHVKWQSEESDEDFSSNVGTISASPEFDAARHQVLIVVF